MTPEIIAKRNARRPGFKLVAYAEVVLPIYRLVTQIITLDQKSIPPIEEFLLRCIEARLCSVQAISSFLGLSERVVTAGLSNLFRSDDILPVVGSRGHLFRLTSKGQSTIEFAKVVIPQEHTIAIHFDCLLRKPALYDKDILYTRPQVRKLGLVEIPAWPPRRPQLSDLSLQDMGRIIQEAARLKESRRQLLAVKSIEKCDRIGRYAIALVYKSKETGEINVAFAVDGRILNDLEAAFALQKGPQRMGIERFLEDTDAKSFLHEIPEELLREIPPDNQVEILEQKETDAEAAIEAAKQELDFAITEHAKIEAEDRLREASQQLLEAQNALDQITVRFLSVYDHPRILQRAFDECNERLMIISPWTGSSVVNTKFVDSLKQVLQRGVKVYIAYGLGKQGQHNRSRGDEQAEASLKQLATQYSNFRLKFVGNTHAKVLLYDRKYVALGSFNWLSYKGDPQKTFRDEQGVLIAKPELVDEKFDDQIKQQFDGIE